jgi:hypothetical protein
MTQSRRMPSTFVPYSQQNVDIAERGRVMSTKRWFASS